MNLFEITSLTGSLNDLPPPDTIHYLAAKEGLYLRKPTTLGPVTIPLKSMPDHLATMGDYKAGLFTFTAPKLPAALVAQVVAWFRHVWQTYGTEAEVLLTYKADAEPQYRTFIPLQNNSSVSVKSIHDPAHIRRGWQLVGSIHSHCNFSAFHSGTDTQDASSFNGLHITIGKVDSATPEYAAMVMVNGVQFDFEVETLADLSLVGTATAPAWWDRYLTKVAEPTTLRHVPSEDLIAFNNGTERNVGRSTTRHSPSHWDWSNDYLDDYWEAEYERVHRWRSDAPLITSPQTVPLADAKTTAESLDAATEQLYEIATLLERRGLYLSWLIADENGEDIDGLPFPPDAPVTYLEAGAV